MPKNTALHEMFKRACRLPKTALHCAMSNSPTNKFIHGRMVCRQHKGAHCTSFIDCVAPRFTLAGADVNWGICLQLPQLCRRQQLRLLVRWGILVNLKQTKKQAVCTYNQ
jgi:hypothetical protein